MELTNLEMRLADLEKKKSAIVAKEKQLKAKLSTEKRKQENHTKMVLGGAVFGILKNEVPTERKDLDLYGRALKAVFTRKQFELGEMINNEYQRLQNEQRIAEIENGTADLQEHDLIEE